MKSKLRLWYKLILITLLFINGLIIAGLIFPAFEIFCKPSHAKRSCGALKMAWLKWFNLIIGVQIVKEGELPIKPTLWVSNHVSWLDIIVLGQFTPAHFIAKSDILEWPVIGYLAKQVGTIFIRRGDKQQTKATAERMLWLLKQNSTVIAFPEGTTTQGDEVLPFHSSLFQPALLTKAMIQPVTLEYQGAAKSVAPFIGEDTFISHLIRILSVDKIEVWVVFHSGIKTSGKQRHAVSDEARAIILDEIVGNKDNKKANEILVRKR